MFLVWLSCSWSGPGPGGLVIRSDRSGPVLPLRLCMVQWSSCSWSTGSGWSSCSGGPGRWLGGSVVCSVLVLVLVLVLLAGWLFRPGHGPVVFLGLCTVQFWSCFCSWGLGSGHRPVLVVLVWSWSLVWSHPGLVVLSSPVPGLVLVLALALFLAGFIR